MTAELSAPAVGRRTPRFTQAILVATLALTVTADIELVSRQPAGHMDPTFVAPYLWLFSGLFLLRVAGQLVVRSRAPRWLPPMDEWNLTPYRLLLPVQIVILSAMAWLDVNFARASGAAVDGRNALGVALLAASGLYAGSMVVRYVVRMARRAEQRWLGGTIPIVFHWVLASFLFALGLFHASY